MPAPAAPAALAKASVFGNSAGRPAGCFRCYLQGICSQPILAIAVGSGPSPGK
jgi:hypothetical protein